jgi:hypothetical protein
VRTKKRTKAVIDDDDLDNVKMEDLSANNSSHILQPSSATKSTNKGKIGGIDRETDSKSLNIRSEVTSSTHRETQGGGADDNQSVQSISKSPLKLYNTQSVGQKTH